MVRTRVDPCPTACMSDALATEPHRQFIYIYKINDGFKM